MKSFAFSAAGFLALGQLAVAAPHAALEIRQAPGNMNNFGNLNFTMEALIPDPDNLNTTRSYNVHVAPSGKLWVDVNAGQSGHGAGSQLFLYDQPTDTIWVDPGKGPAAAPTQFIQFDLNNYGAWMASSSGDHAEFLLEPWAPGQGHDGQRQIEAFKPGNMAEAFQYIQHCADESTGGDTIYSTDYAPPGCIGGTFEIKINPTGPMCCGS